MILAKVIDEVLDELGTMPFFPTEPGIRAKIGELISRMCANEEQVRWLARKATTTGNGKWKGPVVLRQMLCSRYPAKDGIEISCTEEYPEGIPSDNPARNCRAIESGRGQRAIKGVVEVVSNNPELQKFAEVNAENKGMPKPSKPELEASRRFFIENGLEALCPKK